MSSVGVLTDEHVPGSCMAVLRSIGSDVVRATDELREGRADRELLRYAAETGRVVLTCDTRFTVVNGAVVTDHSGVIYGEQAVLKRRPEDAARSSMAGFSPRKKDDDEGRSPSHDRGKRVRTGPRRSCERVR